MLRIGGPIFEPCEDPEELALQHTALGYQAAVCPPLALQDKEKIAAVRNAFAKHDIVIAEVHAWCNLLDQNADTRKAHITNNQDRLALADEIGARCAVNIAGSMHPTQWDGWDPKNFEEETFTLIVDTVRQIIDHVKPKQTKFTLETMPWAFPDSPDNYLRLIEAIDRPGFGVHLDPVNLINSVYKYHQNGALIKECFDKLGPYIQCCHAKDTLLAPGLTLHITQTRIGTGTLDYDVFFKELAKLGRDVPVLLEHLATQEDYALAKAHLDNKLNELGLA